MPKNVHPIFDYFHYDEEKKKSKWLVVDCDIELSGKHAANLTKHFQRKHKNLQKNLDDKLKKYGKRKAAVQKKRSSTFITAKICREDFLMGCLESVMIDGRPFSVFNGKGMQRIFRPNIEEFNRAGVPITTSGEYLQMKGNDARKIIKDKIISELNEKLVSLQLDLTNHSEKCFLTVNTQYYVGDQFKLWTLAMKRLLDSTASLNIAREIEKILNEFDLKVDDVYAITTDNGPNVLCCTNILQIMQER